MTLKEKIHAHCIMLVEEKIRQQKLQLKDLVDDAENDSKSSAGDKHETARAMMQLEQEKINNQLNETLFIKSILEQINIEPTLDQVVPGSLVKTNKGYLYLSVALGKIEIDGKTFLALSPKSPLGMKLIGKKKKETVDMNNVKYLIEEVH